MIIPDTRLFKSFQPNHMFAWISNEFYWPYNYFVSFFYLLTKVPNKDFFPYSFYTTVYTKINRRVVSFDINIANDIYRAWPYFALCKILAYFPAEVWAENQTTYFKMANEVKTFSKTNIKFQNCYFQKLLWGGNSVHGMIMRWAELMWLAGIDHTSCIVWAN